MRIAILSDTHDNVDTTRAALALLAPHKPELYIHCGDICSPEMIRFFAGLPFHFVFGNGDFEKAALRAEAKKNGVTCHGEFGEIIAAGKRIAIHHGHDTSHLARAGSNGQKPFDYIFSGHTHIRADARSGPTRRINPGALQRAATKSVALLDLQTDTLTSLAITL
jgi:putative phosphoesterase